ncbi:MAG: hypothetical protein JWM43_1528 [Acidobacteriaceae bacterium]|nr:hypothetical protein [Acidobacteriaceae bacterium]
MRVAALIFGLICCLGVALDAFQTIILPRRPTGRLRITRLFYTLTWNPWSAMAPRIRNKKIREQVYSVYGPLSLLLLLVLWGVLLILGFACFFFALGSPFSDALHGPGTGIVGRFATDLYVSGTTIFTLGLGDVVPKALTARALIIFESGVGLGFVALVIGYVPVLYQAFSRREVSVALLDARAGSPPTAAELLQRHGFEGGDKELSSLLVEWERWSAEILESHISYPLLCFYRSQHDNQSWLSALVAILDSCALLIAIVEGTPMRQAQLTFAMARHALVDLGHVFHLEKRSLRASGEDRLPPEEFSRLCEALGDISLRMCGDPASAARLHTIRELYEPHARALSDYLKMPLPTWIPEPQSKDQWRTISGLRKQIEAEKTVSEHVSDHATGAGHLEHE